jgi:hypothetical protein
MRMNTMIENTQEPKSNSSLQKKGKKRRKQTEEKCTHTSQRRFWLERVRERESGRERKKE